MTIAMTGASSLTDPAASPSARAGDHRVAVAAERRERMQSRLVESAFIVFGQRGIDASVIEDVIKAAGVSRGTFYNYFRTNDDLLVAVATEISREMLEVIDPIVAARADPAERISHSVRLHFVIMQRFPELAAFVTRGGLRALGNNPLLKVALPRDLDLGLRAGRFAVPNVAIGVDLVVGTALAGCQRLHFDGVGEGFVEGLAATILRGLGLDLDEAADIATRPLPPVEMGDGSLLIRAQQRERGDVA